MKPTREEEAGGAFDEAAEQAQRIDSGETIVRVAAQRTLRGGVDVGRRRGGRAQHTGAALGALRG